MSGTQDPQTVARWSVGGVFLEALANRDFDQMAATLAPTVRFRAMLPPGPMDWEGPETVSAVFGSWFGGAEDFELVDAAVGEVGGRLHLSWRLRVRPAPFDIGDGWHVIEQQRTRMPATSSPRWIVLARGSTPSVTPNTTDRHRPRGY